MEPVTIPATVAKLSLSLKGTDLLIEVLTRELHAELARPDEFFDDERRFDLQQLLGALEDQKAANT